jgi:hypothetical protein
MQSGPSGYCSQRHITLYQSSCSAAARDRLAAAQIPAPACLGRTTLTFGTRTDVVGTRCVFAPRRTTFLYTGARTYFVARQQKGQGDVPHGVRLPSHVLQECVRAIHGARRVLPLLLHQETCRCRRYAWRT